MRCILLKQDYGSINYQQHYMYLNLKMILSNHLEKPSIIKKKKAGLNQMDTFPHENFNSEFRRQHRDNTCY